MSLDAHLRAFLKDPKGVAALTPTSPASVAGIAGRVASDARLVVEFGPGSGVLTRALLERVGPEARVVAIEANAQLAGRLSTHFADPRLIVVHDSATRVGEILGELDLGPADCVVSGIPFSFLSREEAEALVASTHAALAPGRTMVTYQMFFQPRGRLRVHLERRFRTVRSEFDLRNLPPLKICEAVK